MSAPPPASPPRCTDRATAAIARPPAPNWLRVPLEVMTASGRCVAMCRNPAAMVRSIDACGSPRDRAQPQRDRPDRAEQRAAGHEERGEPGRAERGGRGDRGWSGDRAEVVGERVDRVGAALVGDDLGDEARQAAHHERRRDAGHDEGERDDARGHGAEEGGDRERRGRHDPRAGHERAGVVGFGRARRRRSERRRCSGRGPRPRAARRARRRRAARRPAPGSPR